MMNDYTFEEVSSRNGTKNGETVRFITIRGTSTGGTRENDEYLNITGSIAVSLEAYFTAGLEGTIPDLIKNRVIECLTEREEEEETENAE